MLPVTVSEKFHTQFDDLEMVTTFVSDNLVIFCSLFSM